MRLIYNIMQKCGHFICIWEEPVQHYFMYRYFTLRAAFVPPSFLLLKPAACLRAAAVRARPRLFLRPCCSTASNCAHRQITLNRSRGQYEWGAVCTYVCVPENIRKWHFWSNQVSKYRSSHQKITLVFIVISHHSTKLCGFFIMSVYNINNVFIWVYNAKAEHSAARDLKLKTGLK